MEEGTFPWDPILPFISALNINSSINTRSGSMVALPVIILLPGKIITKYMQDFGCAMANPISLISVSSGMDGEQVSRMILRMETVKLIHPIVAL
jgi:hypothetical protein